MFLKEFDLTGKAAVVVGGGRGIGKGIALAFAEAGADVLVIARSKLEIEQTASEIRGFGRNGMAVSADATKAIDVAKVVTTAISEWGKIDILVNSAGVGLGGGVRKPIIPLPGHQPAGPEKAEEFSSPTSEEEWHLLIDTNITSIFLATRAVGRHMIEQGRGKIINIGSITGAKGFAYQVVYCTTKAAVSMYTRALALEWAKYHIHVNAIAPGYTDTETLRGMFREGDGFLDKLIQSIPLKRLCQPREVGLLAVYLASEASDYLTGQTIYIDGGILA